MRHGYCILMLSLMKASAPVSCTMTGKYQGKARSCNVTIFITNGLASLRTTIAPQSGPAALEGVVPLPGQWPGLMRVLCPLGSSRALMWCKQQNSFSARCSCTPALQPAVSRPHTSRQSAALFTKACSRVCLASTPMSCYTLSKPRGCTHK